MTKVEIIENAKKFVNAHMVGKVYLSTEGLDRLLKIIKEEELVK